jgi:WD40 repeat protein
MHLFCQPKVWMALIHFVYHHSGCFDSKMDGPNIKAITSFQLPAPADALTFTPCLRWLYMGGCQIVHETQEQGWIRRFDGMQSIKLNAPSGEYSQQTDYPGVSAMDVEKEALWMVVGSTDGQVQLLSGRHDVGSLICSIQQNSDQTSSSKAHQSEVSHVKLVENETALLTSGWDRHVKYWDLHTGNGIYDLEFSAPVSTVKTLEDPSGSTLMVAVVGMNGRVELYDLKRQGSAIHSFNLDAPWCMDACLTPNSLWVGGRNSCFYNMDLRQMGKTQTFQCPKKSGCVSAILQVPGYDHHVLVASEDTMRLYNLRQPDSLKFQVIPGHSNMASHLRADRNGQFLFMAGGSRGWVGKAQPKAIVYEIQPNVQ